MAVNVASQKKAETLPAWIRVLPRGRVELVDSREPFEVDAPALQTMVAAFRSRGVDLVIDYEHQSLHGERAPAAGWIKDLEAREDGLWARVEWTPQAREYLLSKEYRYFSPVLRLDQETRKPTMLMHLGLTNVPAIRHLRPLVARCGGMAGEAGRGADEAGEPVTHAQVLELGQREEKGVTMVQLKRILGLDPEAEEAAVWGKAEEVFRELAAAVQLPGEASASQVLGAVAALKGGCDRFREIQEELEVFKSRRAQETAARTVEEALKAGKVSPAQQGWALEYCRRDPEGFQTYVARAPKIVPTGEELQLLKDDHQAGGDLLPEEMAICRSLNISPEAYLLAKDQTGKSH